MLAAAGRSFSTAAGDAVLRAMLDRLPAAQWAFGYGSGVFAQHGYAADARPMVDVVVVVRDAQAWHEENLRRNPADYSFLARLAGARACAAMQHAGCGAYYNPYVAHAGHTFKYGVAEHARVLDDLRNWRTLFFAGRLHKPVRLVGAIDAELREALACNLRFAVAAARLLSPSARADDLSLHEAIAGLSYLGDPRLALRAETPDKARNIVRGNAQRFRELYASVCGGDAPPPPLPPPLRGMQASQARSAIASIVGGTALRLQMAKGVLTAGPLASARYALEKLRKGRGGT